MHGFEKDLVGPLFALTGGKHTDRIGVILVVNAGETGVFKGKELGGGSILLCV